MKQIGVIAMVVVLVVSGVAWIPLAGATDAGSATLATDHENESDDVKPGERLGGVIGVHNAELDGEIGERAFGIAIANADSDEERADIIAKRMNKTETRLEALEQRKTQLDEQRSTGDVTRGAYGAQIATLATEISVTKRTVNASEAHAKDLPDELREERGINVEAIRTLADRADEMSGPEVAEIARSIVGDRVGASLGIDREPGERPDHVENRTADGERGQPAGDSENRSPDLDSSTVTDLLDEADDESVNESDR